MSTQEVVPPSGSEGMREGNKPKTNTDEPPWMTQGEPGGVARFEAFLADPSKITDDEFIAKLGHKRRWTATYTDWRLETCFMAYLSQWRFSVSAGFSFLLAVGWLPRLLMDDTEYLGLVAFFFALGIACCLLQLGVVWFVVPNTNREGSILQQRRVLLLCEGIGASAFLQMIAYVLYAVLSERRCREENFAYSERISCGMRSFLGYCRFAPAPFLYLYMIRRATSLCLYGLILATYFFQLGTLGTDPQLRLFRVDEGCYYTVLGSFLILFITKTVKISAKRRGEYQEYLRKERVGEAVQYHHRRIADTVRTVLPQDCLRKLMRREPIVDRPAVCVIAVTRINDFATWTTSYLPVKAIRLIDVLHSDFDIAAKRYNLEKVVQTDEYYVTSAGLRFPSASSATNVDLILFCLCQRKIVNMLPKSLLSGSGGQPIDARSMGARRMHSPENIGRASTPSLCVGVHQGSASGTVVGTRKLFYGVRGPAMEIALALSRAAKAHEVLVSQEALRGAENIVSSVRGAVVCSCSSTELHEPQCAWQVHAYAVARTLRPRPQQARPSLGEDSDANVFGAIEGSHPARPSARDGNPLTSEPPEASQWGGESLIAGEETKLRFKFLKEQSRVWEVEQRRQEMLLSGSYSIASSRPRSVSLADGSRSIVHVTPALEAFSAGDSQGKKDISSSSLSLQQAAETNEEEPVTAVDVQLAPGLAGLVLLQFHNKETEQAYWRSARKRSIGTIFDHFVYGLVCISALFDALERDVATVGGSILMALGAITAMVRWLLIFRGWLGRQHVADFCIQLLIVAFATAGIFSTPHSLYNVHLIPMQNTMLSIALVVGGRRMPWIASACAVIFLNAISVAVTYQPRINAFDDEGVASPLSIVALFVWSTWYSESFERRTFVNEYILKSLRTDLEKQMLWHRGLLYMLIPSYLVEKVMSRPTGGRSVYHMQTSCVVMDITFPSSSSLGTQQATPPSATGTSSSILSLVPTPTATAARGGADEEELPTPIADETHTKDETDELRTLVLAIERELAMLSSSIDPQQLVRLVEIVNIFGDTVRLCGPSYFPSTPEPQPGVEVAERSAPSEHLEPPLPPPPGLGGGGRGQHSTGARQQDVNNAIHSAGIMIALATKLINIAPRLKAFVACDTGYLAVLGCLPPAFQVSGVVSRIVRAVLSAAPEGFVGVDRHVAVLLRERTKERRDSGASASTSSEVDTTGLGPHLPFDLDRLGAEQSWRVRGAGLFAVVPVVMPLTDGLTKTKEEAEETASVEEVLA